MSKQSAQEALIEHLAVRLEAECQSMTNSTADLDIAFSEYRKAVEEAVALRIEAHSDMHIWDSPAAAQAYHKAAEIARED